MCCCPLVYIQHCNLVPNKISSGRAPASYVSLYEAVICTIILITIFYYALPGTDAYNKLHQLLGKKQVLHYIRQISPQFQTYGVESFHAVINQFALKALAFSYNRMHLR